jgi:hypothetical protein
MAEKTTPKTDERSERIESLNDKFNEIQKKVEKSFDKNAGAVDYDKLTDPSFLKLVDKFRIEGVDFLEIDGLKKTAITKPENQVDYPERRYALIQEKGGRVRFYELLYHQQPSDSEAKEISQKEFEDRTIPQQIKRNVEQEEQFGLTRELEDYNSEKRKKQKDTFGDIKLATKDTEDASKLEPEEHLWEAKSKKKAKIAEAFETQLQRTFEDADPQDDNGYTGSVGNVGPVGLDEDAPVKIGEFVYVHGQEVVVDKIEPDGTMWGTTEDGENIEFDVDDIGTEAGNEDDPRNPYGER